MISTSTQQRERFFLHARLISKAREPMNIGLAPKPRHLALCVAASLLLRGFDGLLVRDEALHFLKRLHISQRLEWFHFGSNSGGE